MGADWQPSCAIELLRSRAKLLNQVRSFFQQRDVLEVETPVLSHTIGTEPQLNFFTTQLDRSPKQQVLYLQTSPEFAMKRLLAAGSGSIYQICKAFRNGESGRFHNPEFTLLEWYRVGYDMYDLMNEVAALLVSILPSGNATAQIKKYAYQDLFLQYTDLDPLVFNRQQYVDYVMTQKMTEAVSLCGNQHALWLDFIFSHKIQPELSRNQICFVYGYPAIQASLARLHPSNPLIAERFEVFIDGIELGNGFCELTDVREQEARFDDEIAQREQRQLPGVAKDSRLLAALAAGLPDCSGVALGLDRILLIAHGLDSLEQVLAFPLGRA